MPVLFHRYALVALACLLLGAPTDACSVRSGYRAPSPIMLTGEADAIIIARVQDGGPSEEPGFRKASLVVLRSLKGRPPTASISIDDAYLASAGIHVTRSDPRNLADPNPDVFTGGCTRHVFKEGMILVVFLKDSGGGLIVYAPPFSRALEDVPSPNAPWVKAVLLYVRATSVPRDKWHAELLRIGTELANGPQNANTRLVLNSLQRTVATLP